MNQTVKLVLYVVLVGALAFLSYGLYSSLQDRSAAPSAPAAAVTNVANLANVAGGTNTPPATNGNAAAVAPAAGNGLDDDTETARRPSRHLGRATGYGVALFFTFIGLAILIARDVSKYFAGRVEDFIFNDNLEGMKDPEYEEAERIWNTGDHLEAIRLMRNYLNKHPREQYVALRIAEIYEKDLGNYLAAALEYEEILKKKLPDERWGWAAIRLANLYSGKLDKIPEATKLLRRIVDEYAKTGAAKKARERLGIPEPIPEAVVAAATATAAAHAEAEAEAEPEPEPEPEPDKGPSHNLPKGFRPK